MPALGWTTVAPIEPTYDDSLPLSSSNDQVTSDGQRRGGGGGQFVHRTLFQPDADDHDDHSLVSDGNLTDFNGAPLSEVKTNSTNGHLVHSSSHQSSSSGGSANKTSPNRADCYWFAQTGDIPIEVNRTSNTDKVEGILDTDPLKDGLSQADREERIRFLRERQAEDRHRKLEELRSASVQAQKYREMQEEERRRKIEEIKYRDTERRHLVEERKKQIWEAEKERRDTILRKSQEREARIEAKRNAQRGSIGFAFGSCTPRMLDLEASSAMIGRRSSSQSNVTLIPGTVGSRATPSVENDEPQMTRKRPTSSVYNLDNRRSDSGEDLMTMSLSSLSTPMSRGRRKTDLIPTIPTQRDSPTRTRSPGRAYSMTRLDLLAVPKRRPLEALREEQQRVKTMSKTKSMTHLAFRRGGASSATTTGRSLNASQKADPRMSKSTSHLAARTSRSLPKRPATANVSPSRSTGSRSATSPTDSENVESRRLSQSMWHLAAASQPRPTRASILRRDARTIVQQQQGMSRSMMHLVPKASSGSSSETDGSSTRAPSSPSRPQSSMSQQSLSSHTSQTSSVSLRARSTPRRPRPLSVAGTIVDNRGATADERQGRSAEKRMSSAGAALNRKPPRAKSVGADQVAAMENEAKNVPTPAPRQTQAKAATPKQSSTLPPANATRKPTIAPKPNLRKQVNKSPPLQSPATEQPPPITNEKDDCCRPLNAPLVVEQRIVNGGTEAHPIDNIGLEIVQFPELEQKQILEPSAESEIVPIESSSNGVNEVPVANDLPIETAVEVQQQETSSQIVEVTATETQLQQVEDGVVAPTKQRITTEEEAKAALAEKRRLAREQAEREAELERQRQEELRRQEEERLRREEEEQRLWEEEQERSRQAERERLRLAIEEQQQKEEEERLRREEENKQRIEKEKAERLAKEEQEKARKENEEKLRKEEEERALRRKRVEAIMSRTRGKTGTNTPPVTTPTKNLDPTALIEERQQLETANDANDTKEREERLSDDEKDFSSGNDTMQLNNGTSVMQESTVIMETSPRGTEGEKIHTNGFAHNDTVNISEKASSPMSDNLVDFDSIEPTAPPLSSDIDQLIDLTVGQTSVVVVPSKGDLDHLSNEDNVNFNVTTNGIDDPFVDNYTKRQETTDLLS